LHKLTQVKRIDELLDPSNENVGDLVLILQSDLDLQHEIYTSCPLKLLMNRVPMQVSAGDLIETVDGRKVAQMKGKLIDQILFGPIDSLCKIGFRSLHNSQYFEVIENGGG
jgi:hypothetical protein